MTETTQLSLEEHILDRTQIRDKISNPRFNVGYVALDILKEAGFDIRETSYRKLEAIIIRAQETITPQETYTKTEALAWFRLMRYSRMAIT